MDRRKIQLEAPLKALGVFKVPVKVHPDVTAELSVTVEGEKVQADETAPADPAETSAEKAPAAEAEADSAGEAEAGEDPTETGDAEPAEENE